MIIFMFTLQYIFMVLHLFKHLESIWKPAPLYLIILTVWGVIRMGTIIYEDEKDCKAADFIPESSPASDILKSIPGAAPPAP